jgi:hypothetical protein
MILDKEILLKCYISSEQNQHFRYSFNGFGMIDRYRNPIGSNQRDLHAEYKMSNLKNGPYKMYSHKIFRGI